MGARPCVNGGNNDTSRKGSTEAKSIVFVTGVGKVKELLSVSPEEDKEAVEELRDLFSSQSYYFLDLLIIFFAYHQSRNSNTSRERDS